MKTIEEDKPRRRLDTFRYTLIFQSVGAFLYLALACYVVLAYHLSVAPKGSDALLLSVPFTILPPLLSIPLLVVTSLLVMMDRLRKISFNLIVIFALIPVSWYLAYRVGEDIRHQGFVGLAKRSKPVVQAINDYQTDHGSPPSQLTDLVPRYLSSIPGTGMGAYPEYHYEVHTASATHWAHLTNEPWVLWLDTPRGILDFDMFIYLPSQNYATWAVQYGSDN